MQALALVYFEPVPRFVYQRCVINAGCTPSEASVASEVYRRFDLMACRRECERLQTVMVKYDSQKGGAKLPKGGGRWLSVELHLAKKILLRFARFCGRA